MSEQALPTHNACHFELVELTQFSRNKKSLRFTSVPAAGNSIRIEALRSLHFGRDDRADVGREDRGVSCGSAQ